MQIREDLDERRADQLGRRRVRVGSHGLHYGSGVFGDACRTPKGGASSA